MFRKALYSCTEADPEKDSIIVKSEPDKPANFNELDCKDFDIVRATQYGALERVRELVDDGYDVNKPDNDLILHWAAINNRKEIIKYLLEKGADVTARGGDLNSTPLHWCVRQGHLASTVLLVQAGADPTIQDAEGCACLHLASQFGHTAVLAYLIAKNVYLDSFDGTGMTSLMWASWKVMTLDPVRLLLTLGANPNLQGNEKCTLLHWEF